MAYTIIDRTQNGKRSSGNRRKFVKRVRQKIKNQVKKQVAEGSIDDLVNGKGHTFTVPKKDLSRPTFNNGKGGKKTIVHPGNDKFVEGDRIPRPPCGGGGGQGGGASPDGESEDNFHFTLTHQEYLDMFFEDCELPDLKDTVIVKTDHYVTKRAGFSTDGPVALLNLERTMRMSKGRRIGLLRKGKKKQLEELLLQEAQLAIDLAEAEAESEDVETDENVHKIRTKLLDVRQQVLVLRRKLRAVPFIDDQDLRYNRYERIPQPSSQAVMFCLMDVSASMGEFEKEMAKRYFMLQYLFLTRNYKRVEVVWIRHHSTAKIVDEEEFFKSRESGGTIVSSGLEKIVEQIDEKYDPTLWNIYGSQVSDGDNWGEDSHVAVDTLVNDILPRSQYYTYIEVKRNPNRESDLWETYDTVAKQFANFQMRIVNDAADIYPVFKELFRKNRGVKHAA